MSAFKKKHFRWNLHWRFTGGTCDFGESFVKDTYNQSLYFKQKNQEFCEVWKNPKPYGQCMRIRE